MSPSCVSSWFVLLVNAADKLPLMRVMTRSCYFNPRDSGVLSVTYGIMPEFGNLV